MTAAEILNQVIAQHRVGIRDIKGRSRLKHIVEARAHFVRRAAAALNLTNTEIGRLIELDRTTVHYHRAADFQSAKKAQARAAKARAE